MNNKKSYKTGKLGEKIARNYLIGKGYQILDTNYHTHQGEIDLICRLNNILVFVEVKTRTNQAFGYPEQAITNQKQQRLAKAAQDFLQNHPASYREIRVDAINIIFTTQDLAKISHLKNILQDIDDNFES